MDSGPVNLATLIDAHPDDAVALISRGRTTTYGELRRQVGALRGGLASLGVQPGERVAIVAANNWFFVVSYLAALGVGAVVAPMNPGSAPAELQRELAATGARVAIVGPAGGDAFAHVDRGAIALEHVIVPAGMSLEGSEDIEALFERGDAPIVDRAEDDLALLMFTAGTSGAPKAAGLTHGNLSANLDQMQQVAGLAFGQGDIALGVMPLFHIFGLNAILGLSLSAGAAVVLVERFDPATTLQEVKEHGITIVAAAPPVFVAWAGLPGASRDDLASLRLAVSGGAPLDPHIAEAFESRFGVPIYQGYGLTETAPTVSSALVGEETSAASIGRPLPGVDVRLVDVEGEDALAGDPGEIWVRGPNVFAGYWQDPDATAAVKTPDGWLRTGDIAVTDDSGALFVVDRVKDLIIVSGFNVFPAEVEEVLLEHPAIEQAAVVGVAHPYSGEAVKAYVVANRHLEEDEVIEFCAERLARYKCPSAVSFVESLPHGLVGKVLRRELREGAEPA